MNVLGIDPGLDGGIAIVTHDMSAVYEVMPTIELKKAKGSKRMLDVTKLVQWVTFHKETIGIAYLEQPGYRPGQSVQSGATVGRNFGIIEGILAALKVPYQIIPPQTWMKVMHEGAPTGIDSKARSLVTVARLFPGLDLRASPKCKNPHDGMAEAILIACYGQRKARAV